MTRAHMARLTRFGVVGGGVTLLTYLLFLASLAMGLHYLIASVIAWMGGVVAGFFAHRRVTFGDRGIWHRQALRYVGVYLLQLLFGTATLAAQIDLVGVPTWLAYPINVLFTATFSYILMRLAVFVPNRDALPG